MSHKKKINILNLKYYPEFLVAEYFLLCREVIGGWNSIHHLILFVLQGGFQEVVENEILCDYIRNKGF